MMGEFGSQAWQRPSALPLGHGSQDSSGFPKVEDLGKGERTLLQSSVGTSVGADNLSSSLTTLLQQICYVLNIWGINP